MNCHSSEDEAEMPGVQALPLVHQAVDWYSGHGLGALVSCPRNSTSFAAGQLAVFQDASDEHIRTDT